MRFFLTGLVGIWFLVACTSTKNIPYFTDLNDSIPQSRVPQAAFTDPVIQPDDILNITIQTVDPEATAAVNQKSVTEAALAASSASNVGNQEISGFLVDKNGEVEIPMLGTIKVAGLTTFEARRVIREKAKSYFVEPAVQVRFANFKVTLIGEVSRPATYNMPNERVSILDALGLAGDLTIYGKRENVLLIRDTGRGEKEMVRFNLNSSNIFQSPYFYLKQNDVIYVEPNKAKVAATDAARNRTYAIMTSAFSVITIIITRLL